MDKPILVVDHHADDVGRVLEALKRSGVPNPVVVARDGREALEYLLGVRNEREPSAPPALILLDLSLPDMDGIEVLRRLRMHTRARALIVVVYTTFSEGKDVLECFHLGANSYVCKPAEFSEAVALVGRLAAYWIDLNVQPAALPGTRAL